MDLKESKSKITDVFKVLYFIYFILLSGIFSLVILHQSSKYLTHLEFQIENVKAKDNYGIQYNWKFKDLSHWELRNAKPNVMIFDPEQRGINRDYPENSDKVELFLILKNHERFSIGKWDFNAWAKAIELIENSDLPFLDTRNSSKLFSNHATLKILSERGLFTASEEIVFKKNIEILPLDSLDSTQVFYIKTKNRKGKLAWLASYLKNSAGFFEIVKLITIPFLILSLFYIIEFLKKSILKKIFPSWSRKFGWDKEIKTVDIVTKKLFIYTNLVVVVYYLTLFLNASKILTKNIQIVINETGFIHSNRLEDEETSPKFKTFKYWLETFYSNPILFIHRLEEILHNDFNVNPKFYKFTEIHNLEILSSHQGEFQIIIRNKTIFQKKDRDKSPEIIIWDSVDPLIAEFLSYKLKNVFH